MAILNIKIDTGIDSVSPVRPGHQPTSFSRAINKLTEYSLHPGKLVSIGLQIESDYKALGTFSINTGGSISFFPDIFMFDEFDHFTFNKDFTQKKGHLTVVKENGRHKQIHTIDAFEQEDGEFLLATFVMQDGEFLMDVSREISVQVNNYDESRETEFLSLFADAMSDKPRMMTFPQEPGFYCIQFILMTKNKHENDVRFNTGALKVFLTSKKELIGPFNANKTKIETSNGINFDICIIATKINEELKKPFCFNFPDQSSSKRFRIILRHALQVV